MQLALFDFDGTLCRQDSFSGFFHFVFDKPTFYWRCAKISPYIAAYYRGQYPAMLMRPKLYYTFFRQFSYSTAVHLAEQYADKLITQLQFSVYERLKWHQQQGHQVVIVSASLDLYLQPLASALDVEVICTQTEHEGQYLTGFYAGADCSGNEKVNRIKSLYPLEHYRHIYAYGNSEEDFAMLNSAHQAFWVHSDGKIVDFANIV